MDNFKQFWILQNNEKKYFPYIFLHFESNNFPFANQSNSDISLLNSGFNDFTFSGGKDENLNNLSSVNL